ncbi:hypothetical protein PoB_003125300 [Plakobranchus ocellatus]|uniref:Uncharacterized protein n=1 Tax=Plakobranchus ocellatus TaxID=259542 RepID=A0AAV4ABW8_9GAST|nr:hypothetical protein PoB_003125300 [Plakobranchus ocellatus]
MAPFQKVLADVRANEGVSKSWAVSSKKSTLRTENTRSIDLIEGKIQKTVDHLFYLLFKEILQLCSSGIPTRSIPDGGVKS